MCGVCGILDFNKADIDIATLTSMVRAIEHRGPDHQGVYASGPVGFGHARLSIIDLSPSGNQPMVSQDKDWVLTYNGEIYNFLDLRKELEQKGITFSGRSDTEVILNAFREWGTGALTRLKGMFALAVWHKRERKLYLARDLFGIKPLYYRRTSHGLIFASEIKGILASGKIERRMNMSSLNEYLYYGAALGTETMFEEIDKLLPGHLLTAGKDEFSIRAFATLAEVEPVSDDIETATRETRTRLKNAVVSHLISDVPVGVFLSGGIDSSTITALASSYSPGRIKTFSVGFDFAQGVNELQKAREVAKIFGTDHQELHVDSLFLADTIEKLVRSHDEPFGDAADIPLFLLCQELKGTIKVVLQGDGGDEIFAGYRRYNILSKEFAWRISARMGKWAGALLPPSPTAQRIVRFCQAMTESNPAHRMALLLTEETLHPSPSRILSPETRELADHHSFFRRYEAVHQIFEDFDPVQRMLFIDCHILLPDIFLEKVDKSTMAHGIEVRVPFLDSDLTKYVMGLPSTMKVHRGEKKWLIRNAMRGIIPGSILDGKKTGFSVPYAWWLRTSLADYLKDVLFDSKTLAWGIFDRKAVENCIHEHFSGQRNNGLLLYKLLQMALWHSFYLRGANVSSTNLDAQRPATIVA